MKKPSILKVRKIPDVIAGDQGPRVNQRRPPRFDAGSVPHFADGLNRHGTSKRIQPRGVYLANARLVVGYAKRIDR